MIRVACRVDDPRQVMMIDGILIFIVLLTAATMALVRLSV
jgi:hypothetical protein